MLRIGLDLGGTKTEGIVMDEAGKILLRARLPTPQTDGYDAILQNIYTLVRDLEKKTGQACHVGIGTPGAISTRTGCLKNSNTVCLNGKPIRNDLEKILGRPIRIANDANCFALSEALDGAGKKYGTVFGVILGTGVGGSIVFHGKLHEGAQHIAGEWGHNVLEADGPSCYCGKRGCVETFLSGPGLVYDWSQHGGDASLKAKNIVALADQGDAGANAALQRYLYRFGKALSVVINILDPDAIVLGGGMSNIRQLYKAIPRLWDRHVFSDRVTTRLVPARFGDASGVRGAAWLWPVGTA